jgi:hypothetical protein
MTVLSEFVEECRNRYLDSNRPRVIIHLSDGVMMGPVGEWGNVKTKTRRPLNTLALELGVMESLIADVKEFQAVEDWYTEAGIPHHRGYLLHGPPGTGKSESFVDSCWLCAYHDRQPRQSMHWRENSVLRSTPSRWPLDSEWVINLIQCPILIGILASTMLFFND